MNVLVVNIGSTSFKYRLFDMADERELARGQVEGVGRPQSRIVTQVGDGEPQVRESVVGDHADAIRSGLSDVLGGDGAPRVDAVGFKAVHGGPLSDAVRVTPEVLRVMDEFRDAAPAHNPPYLAAMRAFADEMPGSPLVAAFETGFHQTIPAARQTYAIPFEWTAEYGVRRYGFHGASHRWVAVRTAELLGRDDLRIVSCHLGGSSSVSAIDGQRSVANSFGMTPQTGLPQNDRVGDFDAFALPTLKARTGLSTEEILAKLARGGGLLGISGVSGDMREVLAAAAGGDERAELAVGVFVESVRHYLGASVVALGGLDVLVFTGGIGQGSAELRCRICQGLEFLGVSIDRRQNELGGDGVIVSTADSAATVLVLGTNEELIVARQTCAVLENGEPPSPI